MVRALKSAILLATVALAGCAVGPDYRPAGPAELGLPGGFSVPGSPGAPSAEELQRWWDRFDDPMLAQLVDQSRAANLDIAQAVARLRQAREALVQSRASLLPTINGSAGYGRSFQVTGRDSTSITLPDGTVQTFDTGSGGDSFSLGLDAQYQVGLFGEIGRQIEASRASYEAGGYDYANVLTSVQAEVARNYVLARLYQAQLVNARESLAIQDDNLEIAGFRVRAGLVSSLDAEQARGTRAQTAAGIPSIEQSYNAAVSRLGVLTGQAPGALKPQLAATLPIPVGPDAIAIGIPADALRQRPDVRLAERNLAAATAQIGVATAALYPQLAISGNVDANSDIIGNLLDAITGNLFAGLTQSIFNGGRLRSQVRGAEAAADGAFSAYRQAVLLAIEEIENAAVALDAAKRREAEFAIALDAANTSAILSRNLYRSGLTDFTTLNTNEAALISARNGVTQARADRATAVVQLYLALGGGWDPAVTPTAPETN